MMDGRYRVEGRRVIRSPEQTATGFRMGFRVCELHDMVNDDAVEIIATALNMHLDAYPDQHGCKASDLDGVGQSDGRSDKITDMP